MFRAKAMLVLILFTVALGLGLTVAAIKHAGNPDMVWELPSAQGS